MSIPGFSFGLSFFISGKPANAANVGGVACVIPFRVLASTHQSNALTAATASTVFTVKKNGASIGTCTFAASGTSGSWSITQTDFAAGDYLTVAGPTTADSTLADISLGLFTVGL